MSKQDGDLVRDMMDYGIDVRGRRVFLQAGIEGDTEDGRNTVETVTRGLLFLDRVVFPSPVQFWICSDGGGVEAALAMYDVIQMMRCPVTTIGHGMVASAAGLLLAAGTYQRLATPNCTFMAHEGTADLAAGSLALQEAQVAYLKGQDKRWAKLMGYHTAPKRTARWWSRVIREKPEIYLDVKGMISHGIIDGVMERL